MKVTTNNSLLQFIKLVKSALNGKANSTHTHSVATTSANGLMSSTDKSKLDGIASGANKYSLPTATSSVLGGVKVGSNITNSNGTISLSKANVTSALGYTPPTTNSLQISLLWTNPSPTSNFNPQTISISSSVYSLFIITSYMDNSATTIVFNTIVMKNTETYINTILGSYSYFRQVKITNNSVIFGSGYVGNGASHSANNGATIPYKIYGIK